MMDTTNRWDALHPKRVTRHGVMLRVSLLVIMSCLGLLVVPARLVHASGAGWQTAPPLPAPLDAMATTTGLDGTIYAIGGEDGSAVQSTVYTFKPGTDTAWQTMPSSLPAPRAGLAATTGSDGTIYAIGGLDGSTPQSTVYSFKPGTDTAWQTMPSALPAPRAGLAATTGSDGTIYAIGGGNSYGAAQGTVYTFKPGTDTAWQTMPSSAPARLGLAATTGSDGTIYAIGGFDGSYENTVYSFKPGIDTAWQAAPALPTSSRSFLAATTGSDGTIYAIAGEGGVDAVSVQSTVYSFKPGTDTAWKSAPSLPDARGYLAAATGSDGTIYAIGGIDSSYNSQSTVYSFNPAADTTPPTVTISTSATPNPTTGWYTSGTGGIAIDVSATDPSGVTRLSCTDGSTSVPVSLASPNGDGTPGHPYQGALTLTDGPHSIACSATDGASNTGTAPDSTTMPVTYNVDQTAPTVTCRTPAPTFVYGQSGAEVVADVTDATSGPLTSPVSTAVSTTTLSSNPTASLTGYDNAGNSFTQNCPYSVGQAQTNTGLTSSVNPATLGQSVMFMARVSVTGSGAGTPSGMVTFKDGSTTLGTGTLTPAGVATYSTTTLLPGSHSITAVYSGDPDFTTSTSSSLTQLVRYGVKLLYKPPMSGKVGSAVPIKFELTNAAGQNVSSPSIAVRALCVVPAPVSASTTCATAPAGFNWTSGTVQSFTYLSGLAPGGGYQFNVKTTGPAVGKTYQLLFRVAGEDSSTFHPDANAIFTLKK